MFVMPMRLWSLGWQMRRFLRRFLPVMAVAAVVAVLVIAFLFRTDIGRIAERVQEPYAIIEVLPESLQENWVAEGPSPEGNRGQWVLAYSTQVSEKRLACDEILVKRRLERIGEPRPFAENSIPTKPLGPVRDAPMVITGQAMLLPSMLTPANYVFLLEIVCFQRDPVTGVLVAMRETAQAPPLCFRVPGIDPMRPRAPISMLPLRCQDQLTTVRVKVSGNPTLRVGQR